MAVNNRTPTFLGDLRAQVGAAQLGVRRLKEILERFGVDAVRAAVREHHRLRQAALPRGGRDAGPTASTSRTSTSTRTRTGNTDIHVHCKVTVRRLGPHRRLHRLRRPSRDPGLLDLRQHARLRGGAARRHDGPDHPEERGLLRLDRPDRAEGLLSESARRAARWRRARTIPAPRWARRSPRRSSRWCPERSCPQIYKMGMPTVIFGTNPRTGQALHRPLGRHASRPTAAR